MRYLTAYGERSWRLASGAETFQYRKQLVYTSEKLQLLHEGPETTPSFLARERYYCRYDGGEGTLTTPKNEAKW